jgi:hypothetical protein
MKIDKFEIDSYGSVKIRTYKNGRSRTTEYNNVPKEIIMKFLNAKTSPEDSDFEGWYNDWHNKEKKNSLPDCCGYDWWTKECE